MTYKLSEKDNYIILTDENGIDTPLPKSTRIKKWASSIEFIFSDRQSQSLTMLISDLLQHDGTPFDSNEDLFNFLYENTGKDNGGEPLTLEEKETLRHFEYVPSKDKLVSDVPIETTLSSYFLGEQHSITSGNENVFFTNLSSNINWNPSWAGVKDQSVTVNQDHTGLINMSSRLRGEYLQFVEVKGGISASNTTTYSGVTITNDNFHANGVKFRLAENLSVGDVLKYRLFLGSDNSGRQVFEQDIKVDTSYSSGDFYELWYSHPDEARANTSIFAEIVRVDSITKSEGLLNVYSIDSDPNNHWIELRFRTFEDVNISLDNMLEISSDEKHLNSAHYLVDTTGGVVNIEIPSGVVDSFVVSDCKRKFNSNNCYIKIMNADGATVDHELRLRRRDKTYMFYFDGSVWKYRDITKGQYVAIASVHVDTDDFAESEEFVTKAEVDSLYIGYLGNWDASTNTPDLNTLTPNVGYYFDVSVEGTHNGTLYKVNDQIKWDGSSWVHRQHLGVRLTDLEGSTLNIHGLHVKSDYSGGVENGSSLNPYSNIQDAVDAAIDGDSIYLHGVFVVNSPVLIPSDKSLYFYGNDDTEVKYSSFNGSNDKIFHQSATSCSKKYVFNNIKLFNSGDYAIYIRSAFSVEVTRCELAYNGWSGNGLDTVSPDNGSLYGYDSTQADLQSFWSGSETSNGGAMRVRDTSIVNVTQCKVFNNLRGIRVQDCGANGYGYISRNQCYNNIESGIYLASGSYNASGGCENFTVYNNASKYNANNGILIIGGINNIVSLNIVEGNWNAGVMGWHVSNTRFRDLDLTDNNRSQYNGIGNTGDAHSSISIHGDTINPSAYYIADVLSSQIYNTGLGSNTDRVGLIVGSDVSNINDLEKCVLNIDNLGFKNQDYAIDVGCDLDKVRLTLGDCRYLDTTKTNVRVSNGYYYELPFSNHHTNISNLDISTDDTTSQIILKEGVHGDVLNTYGINTLQAVAFGSKIRIILKGSKKIQLEVEVSTTSINGSMVNSVLVNALVELNDIFTNTSGFASGGDPVVDMFLSGFDLTTVLQSGASYTVDVTTLGVDENKFVSSGALNGSNLELTMNDASIITIDASNMINGSSLPAIANNWYIAYGSSAGTQVLTSGITAADKGNQPFYNGDFLEKGQEYIWTHDDNASYVLGIWNGLEQNYNESEVFNSARWSTSFVFGATAGEILETSVGVDVATRFSGGYAVTNNTVLALRYGNDNYLYLYDISSPEPVLIGKSNTALVGDSQAIYFGGGNQPNAKFPVTIKRTDTWTIVADFDNSEGGEWSNGIEAQTIIKSNLSIEPGYKFVWQLPESGNNRYYGIGYTGSATGDTDPVSSLVGSWRWHTSEVIQYANDWVLNTSNSNYDDTTFGVPYWYNRDSGSSISVSYRYNSNNTLEMWDEDLNELIMTYSSTLDGSPLHLFYGATSYASAETILPNLSAQQINQDSQPNTSKAPEVSNQIFDLEEGQPFSIQIEKDSGSVNIINQYVQYDAPSWAVLNQSTGQFAGTAPAFNGSSDTYAISCAAANTKLGGSVNFNITINVTETTYTNTKSLKFADNVNSYLGGNAALVTALERSGNGSGSSDSWSVGFWYKRTNNGQTGQTLFYFGNNDISNNGYIEIKQTQNGRIRLRYGSNNNFIQKQTTSNHITTGDWVYIMVTYNGGTTGSSSGSISDYYSRFKIFANGAEQNTANSQNNYGYNNSIVGQNFRFGRLVSGNYPKDGLLNTLTIWDSDQSSNASGIYNGGVSRDIMQLSAGVGNINTNYLPPAHHYEIENSTTTIEDLSGVAHLVGYNFNSSDLINDAPPVS